MGVIGFGGATCEREVSQRLTERTEAHRVFSKIVERTVLFKKTKISVSLSKLREPL